MEPKKTTAAVPQAASEWVQIFPKYATENSNSSVTFIKKLTFVAVSTISYLKNFASEDCYTMQTLGGIQLRILKKTCRDEWGQFLSKALLQAFDAFDRKYLHQLALCFYKGECKLENLEEYYVFEYTYNSAGLSMNIHFKSRDNTEHTMRYSFKNVREKTLQLLRACMVITQEYTTEFSKLNGVSLRLRYNENAPPGYQAPGFTSTGEDHLEPTIQNRTRLGCVETPYHKIVAQSFFKKSKRSRRTSHKANPTENPPEQVLTNDMELSGTVEMSPGVRLCCPCNKYGPCDNLTQSELLTCHYCKLQQHAACFGVVRHLTSRVTNHCCSKCYDDDTTRTPTDTKLVSLSMRKRESLCILRRTLELCSEVQTIGARDLMDKFDISESNAANLMQILHSNKIIQQDSQSNTTRQKIMKDQLKILMSNFFHTTEDNIVDLLLTECFASQESVPGPISGALNLTEKISLQNASNKDRYVDNPVENNVNNDINEYEDEGSEDVDVDVSDAIVTPEKRREKRNKGNVTSDSMESPEKTIEKRKISFKKKLGRRFLDFLMSDDSVESPYVDNPVENNVNNDINEYEDEGSEDVDVDVSDAIVTPEKRREKRNKGNVTSDSMESPEKTIEKRKISLKKKLGRRFLEFLMSDDSVESPEKRVDKRKIGEQEEIDRTGGKSNKRKRFF